MAEHKQEEILTPTQIEVLTARSEIVSALTSGPIGRKSLEQALSIPNLVPNKSVTRRRDEALMGGKINADDPDVKAARRLAAFRTAMHQLTQDGVIEAQNRIGPTLTVKERVIQAGGNPTYTRKFGPIEASGLILTSLARGWTASDHEAFDVGLYRVRKSARLITTDGEALLQEALDAFRVERYLSSAIVLAVFAETVWLEAAALVAPQSPRLTKHLATAMPKISQTQSKVIDHFRTCSTASGASKHLAGLLETWSKSTTQMRNFAAHGHVVGTAAGSHTGSSVGMRIIDTYRNVEQLDDALIEVGL